MEKQIITINDIQNQLCARVTAYNARLMIQSAIVDSGLKLEKDSPLSVDDVKNISLELIRRGGPGFHIGRELHQKYCL